MTLKLKSTNLEIGNTKTLSGVKYEVVDVTVGEKYTTVELIELVLESDDNIEQAEAALKIPTVEYNGNEYNVSESSLTRMLAAISTATTMNLTEAKWKLMDGSLTTVTVQDLNIVIALAMQQLSKVVTGETIE